MGLLTLLKGNNTLRDSVTTRCRYIAPILAALVLHDRSRQIGGERPEEQGLYLQSRSYS